MSFSPPPLSYGDRFLPVTWSIKVEPPTAGKTLPDDLSVHVTIAHSKESQRTHDAKPGRDGTCTVTVTPVPSDSTTPVQAVAARVEARQGSVVLATVLRIIDLAGAPASPRVAAPTADVYVFRTLPRPPMFGSRIPGYGGYGPTIPGRMMPRMGGFGPRVPSLGRPRDVVVVVPRTPSLPIVTGRAPNDESLLTVKGTLDVMGERRGSAKAIQPPKLAIGEARIGKAIRSGGEIRRFVGHSGGLWSVAISPDERQLLTGSHDSTVRLWDTATGRELKVFPGHTDHVKGVAFLPDGKRGISGADDDTLRLWDLKTGREVRRFSGHTADLSSVAVSPDGKRALSGANDKTVRLWDVETARELRRLDGHTDAVTDVTFLPDGRRALSASSDGTLRLWDLETGGELRRFSGDAKVVTCVAASPDGRAVIAGGSDGIVRVWDIKSGRELHRLSKHDDTVECISVTADSRRLISCGGNQDRTVRVWNLESGRQLHCLRGLSTNSATSSVVTRDGLSVVLGLGDGTARLWSLPEPNEDVAPIVVGGRPLVRLPDGKIHDVAVGGGGRYLILTLKAARKLAVFDVNVADIVKTIPIPYEIVLVAANAGTIVLAFPDQNLFERYDLETMTRQGTNLHSPINGRLKALAMGSDSNGPLVFVWSPSPDESKEQARFSFVDPKTLAVLRAGSITNEGGQEIAEISPSGGSVRLKPSLQYQVHIRASAGGNLYGIWHTRSSPSGFQSLAIRRATLRGVYKHEDVGHLAPGPDGRTVYTGEGGVRDSEGKPIVRNDTGASGSVFTLPSQDPAYDLAVIGLNGSQQGNRPDGFGMPYATVHSTGDGTALFSVLDLDEMASGASDKASGSNDFTVEKRFHLIPAANLLITIPFSNDRLVLRRLDVAATLRPTQGAK